MDSQNVIERLKRIIQEESNKKGLTQAQLETILALIDEIHRGATISDDFVIRVFSNIGGE